MKFRDKLSIAGELIRAYRGRYLRTMLMEEYIWQRLANHTYIGDKRTAMLWFLLDLFSQYINTAGEQGQRVERVFEASVTDFGEELPFETLGAANKRKLSRWPGLAKFPMVKLRLGVPAGAGSQKGPGG